MAASAQRLPSSGPKREALREKGQFWTPEWVAEGMVGYVLAGGSKHIFDPAVGAGAFLKSGKEFSQHLGRRVSLLGTEIDPKALEQARQAGLGDRDLENVEIREFVLDPPARTFDAIVANPPYIRHHRLPEEYKSRLKIFARRTLGKPLDGRAGIHIYFLLRALLLLATNGRLAFIMPADTCEGIFANRLWSWITSRYRLDAVITFAPQASPFPNVDTNPIIFLIKNAKPHASISWATCSVAGGRELKEWTFSGFRKIPKQGLFVANRQVSEALRTGLSRSPFLLQHKTATLGHFANVMRGIATGSNEFFFLTCEQAARLNIPDEYFIPAIGRTRDISGEEITRETIKHLEEVGRPTRLFSLGANKIDSYPKSVQNYLEYGEKIGLPLKPLIATRKPWYKMETRQSPPILFAYLGRRNTRFVRNYSGAVPLTGFLCVFPKSRDPQFLERLWLALRNPKTVENLRLVGKSYGSGAIKVEPRALEQLPIPAEVLAEVGLEEVTQGSQLQLKYSA
jgi:adenine-specific DNA-methyltransferase